MEIEPRQSSKKIPSQDINAFNSIIEKIIPVSSSEQSLSLEQALKEYKNNSTNSEYLTKFMSSFWEEAGKRVGRKLIVNDFPLTTKEIKEKQEKGFMAIFVPEGVDKIDLGKMFPKMQSWAVREDNSVDDVVNNFGWLWIESSVDAQNRNTTQRQLEEKFKKEGKQGQSLKSYIVGSQISKLLTNKYFDEGPTWSRLLGSSDGGVIISSDFGPDGLLGATPTMYPEDHSKRVGGRSEEIIKS